MACGNSTSWCRAMAGHTEVPLARGCRVIAMRRPTQVVGSVGQLLQDVSSVLSQEYV